MWCSPRRQRILSDGLLDVELAHCTINVMMTVLELENLSYIICLVLS